MMYRPGEKGYVQGYLIDSITKVPYLNFINNSDYERSLEYTNSASKL